MKRNLSLFTLVYPKVETKSDIDIHLAMMSNRIPILLPTLPALGHLRPPPGYTTNSILMSDIFDLPRLSQSIGIPILEIEDLKGPSIAGTPVSGQRGSENGVETENPPWETLGCWSLSHTSQNNTEDEWSFESGRLSMLKSHLIVCRISLILLDLEFSPLPSRVLLPDFPAPYGLSALTTLAKALEYHDPATADYDDLLLVNETEVEQQKVWHPGWQLPLETPENRVACIDAYLF